MYSYGEFEVTLNYRARILYLINSKLTELYGI